MKLLILLAGLLALSAAYPSQTEQEVEESRRVKNYFKDLKIELQDRFVKFGKLVMERYDLGQDERRTEVDNVARIAIVMLLDTKEISRDVAEEALDFLRQYRVNLDVLYDETEKNILSLIKEEA